LRWQEERPLIVNMRNGKGSDEMNRLVIPNVSVEAVLILASVVVTLFAPWSAGLFWFASWHLGGLDAG
jgi:hypothetical protein